MTDKDQVWPRERIRHMWRRYYELPVKVYARGGRHWFHRGITTYTARSLPDAMDRLCHVLKREGVKPFSEFGANLQRSPDAEPIRPS